MEDPPNEVSEGDLQCGSQRPAQSGTSQAEGCLGMSDVMIAVKGLGCHLEGVVASQIELKALLLDLRDAMVATSGSTQSPAVAAEGGSSKRATAVTFSPSRPLVEDQEPAVQRPLEQERGPKRMVESSMRMMESSMSSSSVRSSRASESTARTTKSIIDMLEPLQIRQGFEECTHFSTAISKVRSMKTLKRQSSWSQFDSKTTGASGTANSSRFFKAWSPESRTRKLLDFVGLLIVGYDAFMVPYWLAWQPETQARHFALGIWVTCIFWTLYLPVQLVTGFRDRDARLELDLWRSALNYLKTWFTLDLVVVICDWLSILKTGSEYFRYLRVMRLVRGGRQISKFVALVQTYKLSSQFLEVHLSMDICLLLVFLLWVNHVVSCGWYSVGMHAYSDTGRTWLTDTNFNAGHGPYYEYSTSLHWALTQMTPASMEVVPECTAERIYNLVTIIISMLVFSSFGATLTSSLTQYRLHRERVTTNFMQLQTYLGQQGVEPELALAIRLQVKNHLRKRQRLEWKSVAYLDYASKTLKEALWHSCCMKCIRQHALLNALNLHDSSAMSALCDGAITTTKYSQGDIVFELGIEAREGVMHFLVCGKMFYEPGPTSAEAGRAHGDPLLNLGEGAFISEVALWTCWKHLGTLLVEAPSEVLQLRSEKLVEALSRRFPDTMRIVSHYCKVFHASLHEIGCLRSDLAHVIDSHDLISALETPVRMELTKPILDKLRARGGRFREPKSLEMLDSELKAGKCNIGIEDDEPVRTVSVVAVKLRKCEGGDEFLVKVGEHMRNGELKASCVLPGKKRVAKESARAAMERTLEKELAEIKQFIDVSPGSDKTVFIKDSASYGVRTRYLRTTYNALLSEDCAPPMASSLWEFRQRISEYARTSELSLQEQVSGSSSFRRSMKSFVGGVPGRFSSAESLGLQNPRSGRSTGKRRVVEILAKQESAMLLACDEESKAKNTINIWLTHEEFNLLSTDVATPVIQDWLASVESREQALHARRMSTLSEGFGSVRLSVSRKSTLENDDEPFDV